MTSGKTASSIRLSHKLLWVNLMAAASFVLITGVIMVSFHIVKSESLDIFNRDIESVIHNSQTARELSGVFAEIDYLARTFYRNDDYLNLEGKRLTNTIRSVISRTSNSNVRSPLTGLLDNLNKFLSQCAIVNSTLNARNAIDRDSHIELLNLENLIGDLLVEATLAGEDTSYVTQQLSLVMGYRESLFYIAKLFAELDVEFRPKTSVATDSPVLAAIDDLTLRLQTITASNPEVARYGEKLIENFAAYRNTVIDHYVAMDELNERRAVLDQSKALSLLALENIDKEIAQTARLTTSSIKKTIELSEAIVLVITISVVTILFITTNRLIKRNIRKPMRSVLSGVESFSKGNLDTQIALSRVDEWDTIEKALNNMAADLNQSRVQLQRTNAELEERVAERTEQLARTVDALQESEASLVEAQRIAHLGHWSHEIETGASVWSEEQYRIFGWQPLEVAASGDLFASHLHPNDRERVLATISESVEKGTPYRSDYRIVRRDGTERWIESQGHVIHDDQGRPTGLSGTVLDITERKRVERLLMEEKERVQVTLRSIGDAVIATNAEGRVEYLNPVAEQMTGYTLAEAKDRLLKDVFHIVNEETRERVEDPVARCLFEGKVIGLANHTVLMSRSGPEYAIQDSAAPIQDASGEILGVVLVFSDVTEARRLSRQISYQACHDTLTGLINRHEFERRLRRVLDTASNAATDNAFCYLDLDRFKLVNDMCGHLAGDELLRQVGHLLEENVRYRDSVARLGGDEFGLLMEHCSLNEALQVAGKLVKVIADHSFLWEDKRFDIGVSIGLVAVNESSPDINRLLSAADTACYMAKEQGRNRVHIYQEDDEEATRRRGEMQWAVRLPRALEEGRFRLYFQPMAPIVSGREEGAHYEVLLRLEDGQIVLPKAFLPAAERYNLSSKLDRWVVATAFRWIVDHPAHLQRLHLCAINLSGHSLNEDGFQAFVQRQFADFPIPPSKICFEITETVAIANFSRAADFMNALKAKGCRFALDDFGSGLSSFAYLKNLPVDFLKIDGIFVKDIVDDPLDFAMVKSINEIGHVMGKKTIAEFVENAAILEKLRQIGVDYAQGYGIERPRPIEEFGKPMLLPSCG